MHELLYSKSNTGKETNTSFSKGKQELIDLFFNLAVERDKMPAFMIHHDGIQEALCHLSVCDKTILEAYSLLCGSTRSSSLPMKCIEAILMERLSSSFYFIQETFSHLNRHIGWIEAAVADHEFEIGCDVPFVLQRSEEQTQSRSLREAKNTVKRSMLLVALQYIIDSRLKLGIRSSFLVVRPPRLSDLPTLSAWSPNCYSVPRAGSNPSIELTVIGPSR